MGGGVAYQTLRSIAAGEELFVDYGYAYFRSTLYTNCTLYISCPYIRSHINPPLTSAFTCDSKLSPFTHYPLHTHSHTHTHTTHTYYADRHR